MIRILAYVKRMKSTGRRATLNRITTPYTDCALELNTVKIVNCAVTNDSFESKVTEFFVGNAVVPAGRGVRGHSAVSGVNPVT